MLEVRWDLQWLLHSVSVKKILFFKRSIFNKDTDKSQDCGASRQLPNDTGCVPANLWRQAVILRYGGATRRLATLWRRRQCIIFSSLGNPQFSPWVCYYACRASDWLSRMMFIMSPARYNRYGWLPIHVADGKAKLHTRLCYSSVRHIKGNQVT